MLEDAVRSAQQVGNAAATRAFLQAKLIMGPMVSSGLEFVETPYVGGTLVRKLLEVLKHCWGHILEKLLKQKLGGWVFSWEASLVVGLVGGLMLYDVGKGLQFLLHLTRTNRLMEKATHSSFHFFLTVFFGLVGDIKVVLVC